MEEELFEWDDSDFDGGDVLVFNKIKLKVPIGNYGAGMELAGATIDICKGELQLFDVIDGVWQQVGHFKLHYRLGDKIVT